MTAYEVYVGPTLKQTTSGTNAIVTDLAAGVSYTFTVKATDAAGNRSGASNTVASRTTAAPIAETRAITYSYDGLLRLIGAAETPGIHYQYAYDEVGNRTKAQVNDLVVEQHSYNVANQVDGWIYDRAGNLLQDATNAYTYDALNRLTRAQGGYYEYTYNGDGVLVKQQTPTSTFHYTQDVAGPLSQILQQQQVNGLRTDYIYGVERVVALQGATRTWYSSDALGSVRQTLSDAGVSQAALHYDPWGQVEGMTQPAIFGFTGEVYSSGAGASYLRARWYRPGDGTFASRDPFAGFPERPASLHPYQYTYNNPILYTDPSGQSPEYPTKPEGNFIDMLIKKDFLTKIVPFWPGYAPGQVKPDFPIPFASKNDSFRKKVEFFLINCTEERVTVGVRGVPSGNEGLADLADTRAKELYEIKHWWSESEGRAELYWYLSNLPGYRPGSYTYPGGTKVIGDWPRRKDYSIVAAIRNGVIVYIAQEKSRKSEKEAVWEPVPQPQPGPVPDQRQAPTQGIWGRPVEEPNPIPCQLWTDGGKCLRRGWGDGSGIPIPTGPISPGLPLPTFGGQLVPVLP